MANPTPADQITLNDDTLDLLKGISTATIATLLYKKGFRTCYIQGVAPLGAGQDRMVGPAFTLRYIVARRHRSADSLSRTRPPAARCD
jgi:regulator of RNase E activity RraA